MGRILMILEVSRKQEYIFSSNRLKDNARRSKEITHATKGDLFGELPGVLYSEEKNLVSGGGGHALLEFPDREQAVNFARAATREAFRRYPEMELFVKITDYDDSLTPGENHKRLTTELEKKKAMRSAGFRRLSFGVERMSTEQWKPVPTKIRDGGPAAADFPERFRLPEGWRYPTHFDELNSALQDREGHREKNNFIAVIHIDGNALGERSLRLQSEPVSSWEEYREKLLAFSLGVDGAFRSALERTQEAILKGVPGLRGGIFPFYPIIQAGDDVCFVTAGSIGLECAVTFLRCLDRPIPGTNGITPEPFSACAGVALVHTAYPFHMAYDLAEELCSSAKVFGRGLEDILKDGNPNADAGQKTGDARRTGVSAIDWHIEFGQMKNGLEEIRQDYLADDLWYPDGTGDSGGAKPLRLELRPVAAVYPPEAEETVDVRSYDFFRTLCAAMQGEYGSIARSKLKELRTALKEGETETRFFLTDRQVRRLLEHPFDARYRSDEAQMARFQEMLKTRTPISREPFVISAIPKDKPEKRSVLFDAIEMIDCFQPMKEVEL